MSVRFILGYIVHSLVIIIKTMHMIDSIVIPRAVIP